MIADRQSILNGSVLTEQIVEIINTRAKHTPMSLSDAARLALRLQSAMQPVAPRQPLGASPEPHSQPAVPIKDSIQQEYLICLETGKHFKMLRRHLKESLGMTPDQYREKWGLPAEYPMTAPSYSAKKALAARTNGLGLHQRN